MGSNALGNLIQGDDVFYSFRRLTLNALLHS